MPTSKKVYPDRHTPASDNFYGERNESRGASTKWLERVMNLGENRIEMRIPQSAWFPRDLRFPHS